MTTELYWMTLTVLMTALFWLVYVLERMAVSGPVAVLTGRFEMDGKTHAAWALRAGRAHANAVENLVIFVPAVLTAHALSLSTPATQLAAAVYFFARLAHFVVYVLGVPVARTLAFVTGWGAQIVILASILLWM